MEYMVMECHPSYAVVLSQDGQFMKVANMHYQPGQTVTNVIPMVLQQKRKNAWRVLSTIAACLCMLLVGSWQLVFASAGTVTVQINPKVELQVNYLERVIGAQALNEDGTALLNGYSYKGKYVETVAQELADLAAESGYLSDGGQVYLIVGSTHKHWKQETQRRLETVQIHRVNAVLVSVDETAPVFDPVIPTEPTQAPEVSAPPIYVDEDDSDDWDDFDEDPEYDPDEGEEDDRYDEEEDNDNFEDDKDDEDESDVNEDEDNEASDDDEGDEEPDDDEDDEEPDDD